jgi:hypothetical protein
MRWKHAPRRTMRCAAILMLTSAASCQSGPPPIAKPDLCSGWSPIRPEQHDVSLMSGTLLDQIVAHDRHGAELCGWKAK